MKKTLIATMTIVFLSVTLAQAQSAKEQKQTTAHRTQNTFTIDGVLNEEDWLKASIATNLVQLEPEPGKAPSQKSEIKVLYDNTAIYVGAILYDTEPDKIQKELSQRDQLGNTDWFGIFLNPYQDGINGVSFILTPVGVQFDAQYSVFGEDEGWDSVWEGEAQIVENGWVVELRIPYSAIRFPDKPEQVWNVNFGRKIQRLQEKSFWSKIDPNGPGFLNQFGRMEGISNIKSPVRLSATPFVAGYVQNYNNKNSEEPINEWGRSFNAGMDIKYGLSDAFTLDMTLIPDFGEAQSDNQVLNLSPFEVRFDENRQFFTEGTELFNKGGLFYSRRVGGRPLHSIYEFKEEGEEIVDNPQLTQLYNATKISGRTTSGTGLGFFNAVAGSTHATLRREDGGERQVKTNPLTNYNVMVLDQNLKNNSYFTLINTNVYRDGGDYDANVTGAVFDLRNKKQSYKIRGSLAVNQLFFSSTDEMTAHIDNNYFITDDARQKILDGKNNSNLFGHKFNIGVNKMSGNFQFGVNYGVESHTYDPNDLGFLYNNNEQGVNYWMEYSHYKPFGSFNAMGGGFWTGYSRLYSPNEFTDFDMEMWWWARTKKFLRLNIWSNYSPVESYDYFEPRMPGRFLTIPTNAGVGGFISTDNRKKLQVNGNFNYRKFNEEGRYRFNFGGNVRYRFNDKLNLRIGAFASQRLNDIGYVTHEADAIILGRRDQFTLENSFNTSYTFNNKMALTFRLRHYWSNVEYNRFNALQEDGSLGLTEYNSFSDRSFNSFNIDMIYRWRFAPGSDIFVVWKNSISDFSTDIDLIQYSYGSGVRRLGEFPQSNSFSIKVVYFLDYLDVVKKRS